MRFCKFKILLSASYLFILFLCYASEALSNESASTTQDKTQSSLFSKYSSQIYKIEIREKRTDTKNSYGSGFLISTDGLIATNYHVVSNYIFDPQSYRLVVTDYDFSTYDGELEDIDVINDLALIKININKNNLIKPTCNSFDQGEIIYSFGNPQELGLSIINGTLNGLVPNSINERLHLSASINSGMSGGPTLTKNGSLVGINVSTMGSNMSFLVPCHYLEELYNSHNQNKELNKNANLLYKLEQQLNNKQEEVSKLILQTVPSYISLGKYVVPSVYKVNSECWSGVEDKDKNQKKNIILTFNKCSTNDNIYVSDNINVLNFSIFHDHLNAKDLNIFELTNEIGQYLENYSKVYYSPKTTNYHCIDSYLRSKNDNQLKAHICMRRNIKLGSLYELNTIAIQINENDKEGLISWLYISGITLENAKLLSTKFLSEIQQ